MNNTPIVVKLEAVQAGGTDPGDDLLIARVAGRDDQAFRLLADRYSGLVYSIAYRMLNSRPGAEDIVQEVLIRVWNSAGDWDPRRGASVKTWICRIASNACIDMHRKLRRETVGDPPETADPGPGTDAALRDAETGRIVGAALQELPDRQRMALVMFHYEDCSVAEIAAALDVTAKAAEGLLTRGRMALRQKLEQHKGVL